MEADPLALLTEGTIELVGRVAGSSNLTFVVGLTLGDDYAWAIYKPELGERPLADFERGLHGRERAAHLLSTWLGWDLVPATVVRADAPMGLGSLQWFVEGNQAEHHFTLVRDEAHHDALRRIAVFDVVTNNTDRKSGHVLLGEDGRIWAIDHGLCFSVHARLRTVIWEFGGDPLPADVRPGLERLAGGVPDDVAALLSPREVAALRVRAARLLDAGVLPVDETGWGYPWPLV